MDILYKKGSVTNRYHSCLSPVPFFLLAILLANSVFAEVYKYKGADGKWRFSDKPPTGDVASVVKTYSRPGKDISSDHRSRLEEKYQPANVAERASLAVVKVETVLGSGSGFFISPDGLLVTNRHVVRPPSLAEADVQGNYERAQQNLERARDNLQRQRARLDSAYRNLQEYEAWYRGLSASEQAAERDAFSARKKRYRDNKRDVEAFAANVRRESAKMNTLKNDYRRRHANASIARQFSVYLKDDTRLSAELLELGEDNDLALLRVSGAQLPWLPLREATARQGENIFAIGSPLGNSDYVTAGIVTSRKRDHIVIDAQIHPGNSGGPLLDENGAVLGVNTWKWRPVSAVGAEGFGIAIASDVIAKEFAREIANAEITDDQDIPAQAAEAKPQGDAALREAILREFKRSE